MLRRTPNKAERSMLVILTMESCILFESEDGSESLLLQDIQREILGRGRLA